MARMCRALALAFTACIISTATASSVARSPDVVNPRLEEELARAQRAKETVHPMVAQAVTIDRSKWIARADSWQAANPPSNVLDGSTSTFWHTEYTPALNALPHNITIDMQKVLNLNGLVYTPRQDGSSNGNIGQHQVYVSSDNKTWSTISLGTFLDDSEVKTIPFTTTPARYLRISTITEAGNRGPWSSAADISVTTAVTYTALAPNTLGQWGPTIEFPIVPISAQVIPGSNNLLTWSSYLPNDFEGSSTGITYTSTYNPTTKVVSEITVTNINHDMFCPGLSLDNQGRSIVTGGNTAPATSLYNIGSGTWSAEANMQIARGYQAQATTSDGRIFVIGGSWSGGQGGKNAEIYNVATNTWTLLPGAPVAPMLTADQQGVYRQDNHAWLFAWKNNYVAQLGPSKAMNWYSVSGTGSQAAAGTRASDADAMCGNAAMYDAVAGNILTVGGSPDYQDSDATTNAHIITLGTPPAAPTVQTISSMSFARAFANSVVLPNGQVFIVGGQSFPVPFSDDTSQLTPELFDPTSKTFKQMAPQAAPRNYHSIALLLADGTVFNGGGGLCGSCTTNHRDGQIWSPPYLFTSTGAKAARPVISSVSASTMAVGAKFTATTAGAVSSFSLIRFSSTTHTVNTDQRRIPLTPSAVSGTTYSLQLPTDAGVIIPGPYFLFAIDGSGVPSVAATVMVTN